MATSAQIEANRLNGQRYPSARHRELPRTLESLRKMRKSECGKGNGAEEKADDRLQMADDRLQMADDRLQMADRRMQVGIGWVR